MKKLIITLMFIVLLYGCNSPFMNKDILSEKYEVEVKCIVGPLDSNWGIYVIDKGEYFIIIEILHSTGLVLNEHYLTK
jgi:uncharacterized protein YceK